MLQKPPFEYPMKEGKTCVRFEEGKFRVYLDRDAAIELAFGLYWFASDQPIGEEVDITSRRCNEMPGKGVEIGLCELNLIPVAALKKHGKTILKEKAPLPNKQHGRYNAEFGRLDYFVSVEECKMAYESLLELLAENSGWERYRERTLFNTLVVRLVR